MTLLRSTLASFLVLLMAACSGSGGDPPTIDAGTPPTMDGGVCFPLPTDVDGDTISDTHEDRQVNHDDDGDGTPDYQDDDSDGDGLPDSVEAGDDDPCTEPPDVDGDGTYDFRDDDADGNGVKDGDEPEGDLDGDGVLDALDRDDDGDNIRDDEEMGDDPAAPVDTDGDGSPDYHDTDSDGDQISDRHEGIRDDDGDDLPAYLDDDSDGDGILDTVEAGADPSSPVDSDGDGTYNFLDVDSDNDGLPDHREDTNGNGVLDPGESDPAQADTDGDGFPDLVEWAAGTLPDDPTSVLSPDDFYFVLPQFGPEQTDDLNFSTDIIKADVFFQVDTTGSMGGTIDTLQLALQTIIVPGIALEVPNVAMGAAYFKDFPVSPFGGFPDLPFHLTQRITTDVDDVQSGLDVLEPSGGGDGPESGMEALYQAVTGEGIIWTPATAGAVAKFMPMIGFDATKGHGVLGGAGFRVGALPIIVHATDIEYHDAPDYTAAGITHAHSRAQATAASIAMGARFIGVTSSTTARAQLEIVARDTQAVVPPEAWGPTETLCHTGEGGAPLPPDATGLCPLVFSMGWGGTGIDQQVVDAIAALVTFGTIDISARAVSDPFALPAVDSSQFITAITPLPPAPPGSTIDGDVFRDVLPGAPVTFTVHARNTIVPTRAEAQLFRVTIQVMGDGVTALDERDVYVIVPGGAIDP